MSLANGLDVLLSVLVIRGVFIVGFYLDSLWYVVYCNVVLLYNDWVCPILHDFITSSIHRVIRNDCRGFNNSPYTIHLI